MSIDHREGMEHMSEPLTREERVEMLTKNVEAVRKSTHPGVIAAGVTASLCSAIFDLADAFNNIADALRGESAGVRIAEAYRRGYADADNGRDPAHEFDA